MKALFRFFIPLWALSTHQALAQVVSIPLAENISRKQIKHQGVTSLQMAQAKGLAGKMKNVSGKIKGVVDKTRQLHETWYNSLLAVSPGVRSYRRVKEIYDTQSAMIQHYNSALSILQRQGLTAQQTYNAGEVYSQILLENIGLMSELVGVVSANNAKMTDPERLEFINNIADRMQQQRNLMDYYTSRCRVIAQRQMQAVIDEKSVLALMGEK
jgi:hypothetical protein